MPNAAAFGIYDTGPGGTFYLDDTRNPGGAAKILAYSGTGARAGRTWFACESSSGSGGDFADFVVLVNLGSTSTPVTDRKSTRLNSSHIPLSRMPSSA